MDSLDDRQYKLSRTLLSLVGLWPYEESRFVYVKVVVCVSVLSFSLVCQIADFVRAAEFNRNVLLNTLPSVTLYSISIFKWYTFRYNLKDMPNCTWKCPFTKIRLREGNRIFVPLLGINEHFSRLQIKKLIDMIRDNWRSLNNRNEQKIILKHADQGMFVNKIFTCSISVTFCGYAVYLFSWWNSSEASNGQNEVSIDLRIRVNYFMDEETHPYVTLLQVYITFAFAAVSVLGTEITTMLFAHQACGFFHVVGYRVQCAFDDETPKASVFENNRMACSRLISAAKLHKTTLEYCKLLGNTIGRSYFTLLLMGVTSLSLRLVRLSEAMVHFNEFDVTLVEIIMVFIHFVYFFLTNYMGQIIMDNSSKLFTDTYNTRWYATPVATQKLLLFIMHCSMKNYTFLIGGLFVPCYEGFSTLMRMSFSYFTVIYSTQK